MITRHQRYAVFICLALLLINTVSSSSLIIHSQASSATPSSPLSSWSVSDVSTWLQSLSSLLPSSYPLPSLISQFESELIDGLSLEELDESEWESMIEDVNTRNIIRKEMKNIGSTSATTTTTTTTATGSGTGETQKTDDEVLTPRHHPSCVSADSCTCPSALTGLDGSSRSILARYAKRYPFSDSNVSIATSSPPPISMLGQGQSGCDRQFNRLFQSNPPSPYNRRLVVFVGDVPTALQSFIDDHPYVDTLVMPTSNEIIMNDIARGNRIEELTRNQQRERMNHPQAQKEEIIPKEMHEKMSVGSLQAIPCILAEAQIQPSAIYVHHSKNNLQQLVGMKVEKAPPTMNKNKNKKSITTSSTTSSEYQSYTCSGWWSDPAVGERGIFPITPLLLGAVPPVQTHDGVLSQLGAHLMKRIYVDSPCWSVARSDIGAGCLDERGDSIRTIPTKKKAGKSNKPPKRVRPGQRDPNLPPLLAVWMIVKDEAGGIGQTLGSVLPFVDAAYLVDTGSSDKTIRIVREKFEEFDQVLPASRAMITTGPFDDFSSTRNRALQSLASFAHDTEFALMLNGDDLVVNGGQLRKWLELRRNLCGPSEEMYVLPIDYDNKRSAWSERILRISAIPNEYRAGLGLEQWKYIGLTHEVLSRPEYLRNRVPITYAGQPHASTPNLHIGGPGTFFIRHTYQRDSPDNINRRSMIDLKLLQNELRENPGNLRARFYLARTFDQLGRKKEAKINFEKRLIHLRAAIKKEIDSLPIPSEKNTHDDELNGLDPSSSASSGASSTASTPEYSRSLAWTLLLKPQPNLKFTGDGDECYSFLRVLKLSYVLEGVSTEELAGASRSALLACPDSAEIPYYIARFVLFPHFQTSTDQNGDLIYDFNKKNKKKDTNSDHSDPQILLKIARGSLEIAKKISEKAPSHMERMVSIKLIGELEKIIKYKEKKAEEARKKKEIQDNSLKTEL